MVDEKTQLLEELDRIKALPVPARWRAAADFAAKVNPLIAQEQRLHQRAVKEIRQEQDNEFASAKHSGLRFGASIPKMTWDVLCLVDEDLVNTNKKQYAFSHDSNKLVQKLAKAFPEYRIYKRI